MADEDFVQIKIDIGDLKSNVSTIKNDIIDMKTSVTTAIDRISTSMATLATVTEKLLNNDEAHRIINKKIQVVEETQLDQHDKMIELKQLHEQCVNLRRIDNDNKKNSPLNKAKDKAVEYIFILLLGLIAFIMYSHFNDYLKFINKEELNPKTEISEKAGYK